MAFRSGRNRPHLWRVVKCLIRYGVEGGRQPAALFINPQRKVSPVSESSRFVDFRALKAAVTMEMVLAHYGLGEKFRRNKDSLSGPCPIHRGNNPNQFRVSLSKNCWNCFSDCKCGGNVLDFVAKMEGVELQTAANRMIEWFKLDLAKLNQTAPESKAARHAANGTTPGAAERRAAPAPAASSGAPKAETESAGELPFAAETEGNKPLAFRLELDAQHPYLAERKLSLATVSEFGMGGCTKGVMSQRIAIPIHNAEGKLVGYAGRWPGEPPGGKPKYRLPDGFKKSAEIFRLAQALQEPAEAPWVIVEGFFDAAKFWQLGIKKCVALMGSSLSSTQEALLVRHLAPTSHVVVVFDEDDAGRAGREDIVRRLAAHAFVRFVAFDSEDFKAEHLTAEAAVSLGILPAQTT